MIISVKWNDKNSTFKIGVIISIFPHVDMKHTGTHNHRADR